MTILEDVNVGVAATVAAAICDVADIGSINVLVEAVDSGTGESETVCTVPGGDITLTQNAGTPASSPPAFAPEAGGEAYSGLVWVPIERRHGR